MHVGVQFLGSKDTVKVGKRLKKDVNILQEIKGVLKNK